MPATLTVTGTVGPAIPVAGLVIAGVTEIRIDTVNNMLYYKQGSGPETAINVAAAITVTSTKAGNVWTLVIANT